MTQSISELLGQKNFSEPPEIAIIRKFIQDKFDKTPSVSVNDKKIIITVEGSALAGALRPELLKIKQLCQTDKQLIIRIK